MKPAMIAVLLIAATATPAVAHHSFAMFDYSKTLTISGTVKELQWANPHVWLELVVPAGAQAGRWSFEGGSVTFLRRVGWSKDAIKPGDKVVVVAHPLKQGHNGGSMMQVTLANGKVLQGGGTLPSAKTDPGIVEQ